jgi:putative tricarboxylic transport membrane protein
MDAINGLMMGFSVLFTAENLYFCLLGSIVGTLVGVLPGIGPLAALALLLPVTFQLSAVAGLGMLAAIFYGAMYGGSTTAILVNMPGESASVITCLDGYKLTKKGRAGAVLTIVAAGSFVGGVISVIGVMLFAPALAEVGLLFGPAEFFALTAGGLLLFSRISGGSLAAGIFPMAIGLMLSTVGQEAVTGQDRFTFGIADLTLGVELVALVVGLYGIAEIMSVVETLQKQVKPLPVRLRDMFPSRQEWRRSVAPYGRGTILGFIFGLLPGPLNLFYKAVRIYNYKFRF